MSKQYTFGEIKKTLKKNTYEIEELAKEASGLGDDHDKKIMEISVKHSEMMDRFNAETDPEEKLKIMDEVIALGESLLEISRTVWYVSFDRAMKVMDILLVEGSEGLTRQNFGQFDAQEIWNDFFSNPLLKKKN